LRVLLTGCNGQLGRELTAVLGDVVPTGRSSLDLTDSAAIRRAIREAKPEAIVNAAAYTAVDKAESEVAAATQVNAVAPGVLAEEARRLGALLVYYSTDYIFDGSKRTPYTEEDEPNPLNTYGRTKLEGEARIRASGCRHLIIRTSWVYGPHAANFYQIIRRKALANEPIRMVDDQTSVPTPAAFLADCTAKLLEGGASGLLNVVPSGQASRYDFACEVVRVLGSRSPIARAKSAEFPSAATRPAYSVLDNGRAQRALGRPLPDWKALFGDVRESRSIGRKP
jgi:dTDP-4-dehydrorhamnose reductase